MFLMHKLEHKMYISNYILEFEVVVALEDGIYRIGMYDLIALILVTQLSEKSRIANFFSYRKECSEQLEGDALTALN